MSDLLMRIEDKLHTKHFDVNIIFCRPDVLDDRGRRLEGMVSDLVCMKTNCIQNVKNVWTSKSFGRYKILDVKHFWTSKIVGRQKFFGRQNFLDVKNC